MLHEILFPEMKQKFFSISYWHLQIEHLTFTKQQNLFLWLVVFSQLLLRWSFLARLFSPFALSSRCTMYIFEFCTFLKIDFFFKLSFVLPHNSDPANTPFGTSKVCLRDISLRYMWIQCTSNSWDSLKNEVLCLNLKTIHSNL